jgi:hypothetical protein
MAAVGGDKRTSRADLVAAGLVVLLALWVFAPFFRDTRTMGFQDWDEQAAFRYVSVLALRDYGQWPFWNAWYCGGFPAWGYVESATNVVSPFAPFYFAFAYPLAARLEAVAATVVGVLACYLLAGRYTRSPAWRAFVAAVVMLSSRWALQVASGHLWHLAYAWMPLAIYFFDRAADERRVGWAAAAGATMALMTYLGGIYPVPHTALLLGAYAVVAALTRRSWAPLGLLAVTGLTAVGLGAPKLLPALVTMARFPRLIASHEPMTLADLWVMLTAHDQSFGSHPLLPIAVSWVWWEWGMYIGVAGVLALVAALATGLLPGPERRALLWLRLAGAGCFLLALGQSAWQVVHALPYFRSQHVPSRLLWPGVLCLALALAGAVAEPWRRFAAARRWAEPALLVVIGLYGLDLAVVSRQATVAPFRLGIPEVRRAPAFEQLSRSPYAFAKPTIAERRLRERFDWPAKIMYPTMLANQGVVRCYGVPPEVTSTVTGRDQPGDRGLVYLASGRGTARLVAWSPNAVTIEVAGASPGDLVVYDMNFDGGWRADGAPARDYHGLVAAPVAGGTSSVRLHYRPRGLVAGLVWFAATVLALGGAWLVGRRRRASGERGRSR